MEQKEDELDCKVILNLCVYNLGCDHYLKQYIYFYFEFNYNRKRIKKSQEVKLSAFCFQNMVILEAVKNLTFVFRKTTTTTKQNIYMWLLNIWYLKWQVYIQERGTKCTYLKYYFWIALIEANKAECYILYRIYCVFLLSSQTRSWKLVILQWNIGTVTLAFYSVHLQLDVMTIYSQMICVLSRMSFKSSCAFT